MKWGKIRTIAIFLLLSSSMFSTSGMQTEQVTEEIRIGGLFPLSGSLALGGIERNSAFHMAIQQINDDPDLLQGYQLVGITEDTGTDPEIAVPAATRLINQNVVGFIGASSSSVSSAIAEGVGKDAAIPQISYSSTSPALSDTTTYPYFLRVVPSDALQNLALVDIVNEFNWDIVSILRSSDLYGQGVGQVGSGNSGDVTIGVDSLANAAAQLNIEVIEDREISPADDIEDHLRRIKFFGSNIVILNVYLEDAIEIFEATVDLDMTSTDGFVWIGSDASSQQEILEASAKSRNGMQGMIGLKPLQPSGLLYDEFLDLWENCAGLDTSTYPGCGDRSPNFYAPFAYDATVFLAQALQDMIENNQDIYDGDLLLNTLLEQQITGVTGEIQLNNRGDRESGYDVINVQQDEFVTVGSWQLFNGFVQTNEIYWQGDPTVADNPIPQARLASSWLLLLSVIIIPVLIFTIRKVLEIIRKSREEL